MLIAHGGVTQTQGVSDGDPVLSPGPGLHTSEVTRQVTRLGLRPVRQLVTVTGTSSPPPRLAADHRDVSRVVGQPLLLQEAALVQTSSALLSVTGVGASVITRSVASFDSITFVTLKINIKANVTL